LTLDTLAGDVQNPRIAMDGTGKAMVLWEQVDTDLVFSIYALKYAPASGWEVTPKLVETLKPVAGNPRLVMDTAGNVTAVWEQGGSIFSSYYTYATAVWSIPVLLENTNGTAANPELALASTGDVFAVWYDVDSTGLIFSVYTNSLTKATGLWGAATVISTITPGFAVGTSFLPQVATDASGAAVAVWQHPTALGINNTFTSRYTAAAGWGAATALQTTSLTLTGDTPRAAMDGAGNAMAVWQQDDLTQTNIMARQYK
ncbi:MAG: hypothetical protein OEW12_06670, partial [Deltaproteobacteria bacterium]|nr:hypothetical protein [Deltaproteobacteria bacterium]